MVWVSTETRVVWGHTEIGVVWTSTWAVWISVWVSTETKAILLWVGFLWLSVCSVWSPRYGGKVDQEGAEGFTPKSIPLGHKSGIFRRDKKGNTYDTSTHFPYFLQNQSNCKTVLYLRDPPAGHSSPFSSGYRGHAVSHRKTRCVCFKPLGSNLFQFFRIQFKGVRLELLAPICKREKKATSAIFLPEASLLALDEGVDRFYTKSFSFLVRLSLSLTDAVIILVPPSSTTKMEWGCTRGRPDGIPDWRPALHH